MCGVGAARQRQGDVLGYGGPRRFGIRTLSAPSTLLRATRRWAGVECRSAGGGTVDHRHRITCMRGQLQSAHPRVFLHLGALSLVPEEHRAARSRLERLLGGPERVLAVRGPDHEAAVEGDAPSRDRRRVRQVRRIDPRDQAIALACLARALRRGTSPPRCPPHRAAPPRACPSATRLPATRHRGARIP
jgi:hypothetical protein